MVGVGLDGLATGFGFGCLRFGWFVVWVICTMLFVHGLCVGWFAVLSFCLQRLWVILYVVDCFRWLLDWFAVVNYVV